MAHAKKRKVVVDKRLQYGFMLLCLSYLMLFLLVVSVVLFMPLILELKSNDLASSATLRAAEQLLSLHEALWPVVFALLGVMCLLTIYGSRKFASPLYHHRKILRAIGDGVLPKPFRSRKGYYLSEDASIINEMLKNLRLTVGELQEEQVGIQEALVELLEDAKRAPRVEILEGLSALSKRESQQRARLKYFSVEQ